MATYYKPSPASITKRGTSPITFRVHSHHRKLACWRLRLLELRLSRYISLWPLQFSPVWKLVQPTPTPGLAPLTRQEPTHETCVQPPTRPPPLPPQPPPSPPPPQVPPPPQLLLIPPWLALPWWPLVSILGTELASLAPTWKQLTLSSRREPTQANLPENSAWFGKLNIYRNWRGQPYTFSRTFIQTVLPKSAFIVKPLWKTLKSSQPNIYAASKALFGEGCPLMFAMSPDEHLTVYYSRCSFKQLLFIHLRYFGKFVCF